MDNETVDFSAFEADVDRVVEAAANRDAEINQVNAEFTAYNAKLAAREVELRAELTALGHRRATADRVRLQRITEARGAFTDGTGLSTDEPPF